MQEIANLISDVGFPIACVIVLFWQNSKFAQALNENTDTLRELVAEIRRSGNNDK
jgi:hypothetical protein